MYSWRRVLTDVDWRTTVHEEIPRYDKYSFAMNMYTIVCVYLSPE